MEVLKIITYDNDQNCYLVYNRDTKKGFVIDPGLDSEKILKKIKENEVELTHILLTHSHYDHMMGALELRKDGVLLVASKNGSDNITNPEISLTKYCSKNESLSPADIIVADGEEIEIDGIKIKTIYTEGHTNCSCCYLIEDTLFSGDTLFLRTVGRADLPTGNAEKLKESVKMLYKTLDDEIKVCPGHFHNTTIGYEKKFNMAINENS